MWREREEMQAYDVCGGEERGAVCAGVLEGLRLGQVVSGAAAANSEVGFWCCHVGFSEGKVEEWNGLVWVSVRLMSCLRCGRLGMMLGDCPEALVYI